MKSRKNQSHSGSGIEGTSALRLVTGNTTTKRGKAIKTAESMVERVNYVPTDDQHKLYHASIVFGMARSDTRLMILYAIYDSKCHKNNVNTIATLIGSSQTAISHHLKLMKLTGILFCVRDGKCNIYSLTHKGKKVLKFAYELNKEDSGD